MVAPLWVNRDYLTTVDMPSAFWQLSVSSQHMVKGLTVSPYMSLFNFKLCTHIWSTNINFRPPYIGLFGPSWSELSHYGWIWGGVGGRLGLGHDFVTDGQKRDYLSRASQRARGATKNWHSWSTHRERQTHSLRYVKTCAEIGCIYALRTDYAT